MEFYRGEAKSSLYLKSCVQRSLPVRILEAKLLPIILVALLFCVPSFRAEEVPTPKRPVTAGENINGSDRSVNTRTRFP